MIDMLRSLYDHQAWADSAIFIAVRKHAGAAEDEYLRKTMHHIVLVHRYFLSRFLDRPFDAASELKQLPSLDDYEQVFRVAHCELLAVVNQLDRSALSRIFEHPYLPDSHPTFAETLMQVIMHSQYHRGQCAARLRALGGEPPTTDYIVWLSGRPNAIWG